MPTYKIRDPHTGLYSRGGTEPTFNKQGKAWASLGHLKLHLSYGRDTLQHYLDRNCELVMFEEKVDPKSKEFFEDLMVKQFAEKMKK